MIQTYSDIHVDAWYFLFSTCFLMSVVEIARASVENKIRKQNPIKMGELRTEGGRGVLNPMPDTNPKARTGGRRGTGWRPCNSHGAGPES